MPKKTRQSKAASAWQLEFVRLIAFPVASSVNPSQNWWTEVVTEPTVDHVSTHTKGGREERGGVQGVQVSLKVEFGRITWEARSPGVVDPSGAIVTLEGPFQDRIHWFFQLLTPWLMHSCPPLHRLAFSAKLLQPAPGAKEAYEILATYLPCVNFDPNPNDFLLQLNRRTSGSGVVNGIPINRVATWSKMSVAIQFDPSRPIEFLDRCYSALELDINTAPEQAGVLTQGLLRQLFQELMMLGIDIAERGDVP